MKSQYERNCHELLSAVFFFFKCLIFQRCFPGLFLGWIRTDVSEGPEGFFFSSLISQDYQATQAAGQTVALPSLLPLYAPCFKAAMWWQCCCGQTSVPGAVLSLCCESLSWTTSSARPCGSEMVWPPLIIYQLSRNRSEEQPALSN